MSIDELKQALQTASTPRQRMETLRELVTQLSRIEPRQAELYAVQARRLASEQDDPLMKAQALRLQGGAYLAQGSLGKAFEHLREACGYFTQVSEPAQHADCCNTAGTCLQFMGEFEQALEYQLQALRLYEQARDSIGRARGLTNLGNLYFVYEFHDKALHYYRQALTLLHDEEQPALHALIYHNLGSAYEKRRDNDVAMEFYQKSLALKRDLGNLRGIAYTLNNIADLDCKRKDYLVASAHAREALRLFRDVNDTRGIPLALCTLGTALRLSGQLDEAKTYLYESLEVATPEHQLLVMEAAHKELSMLYYAKADYEKALHHHKEYSGVHQKMFDESVHKRITEMQSRFDMTSYENQLAECRMQLSLLTEENRKLREENTRLRTAK